jgi:glutaredoxin 2
MNKPITHEILQFIVEKQTGDNMVTHLDIIGHFSDYPHDELSDSFSTLIREQYIKVNVYNDLMTVTEITSKAQDYSPMETDALIEETYAEYDIDFSTVYRLIESKHLPDEDKRQLIEMTASLDTLMQNNEALNKGVLKEYRLVARQYPWILTPFAQCLLDYIYYE